jgi:SAM-dependent methyltransferase
VPYRERFDCLWCGRAHAVRGRDDLEGWASLCPRCIGRAGENGFLRARLRAALAERSGSTAAAAGEPAVAVDPWPESPLHDVDDYYRRTGRYSSGPIADGAWLMELDSVTTWIDALRLGGVVVELGAGTGWWSPLLAAAAELWVYDPRDEALERVRSRLVAHGLRAHLHRRDLDGPADRTVDAVFTAFALGAAADAASRSRRLEAIAGWLRPGGSFVLVEAGPGSGSAGAGTAGPDGPLRTTDEADLRAILDRHGFALTAVAPAGRALIAGRAEAILSGIRSGASSDSSDADRGVAHAMGRSRR